MTKKELLDILAAADYDAQIRLMSETAYEYEYPVKIDSVMCAVENGNLSSKVILSRVE